MAIPVIDFSKLDGEDRAKTLAQIAHCCEEWGFFQLVNHGIPEELLERVKKVASECYKLEREENFKNSKPVKLLNELVEKKSEDKLEKLDWEDLTGLRAHTDAGGIILLFQDDEVKGLQILKDWVWIDVQPMKNSIVINTGDQIEVLSNGRYKSVWHRVFASADGNRRSIASFYNPSLKATIEPAQELVEKTDKQVVDSIYPKFVFGDYMAVYTEQKFLPKEPRFQAVKAK
ncbi:1-aminocyclopropane-1-carboxylate oxidase 5-like [Olea europaea subsp. europaea]|uniref:1-aminocyclopropane-1-carboxylate oxidase 5-like n=1 Tax=Olea europaea subsp. europaea TaxID=158383 RepID=A0A8S0UFE3_OLEEU|nr:1-aminocyclopropane-1-carboxylate oxidase 5-like [Olea europaea subsp. europaea]